MRYRLCFPTCQVHIEYGEKLISKHLNIVAKKKRKHPSSKDKSSIRVEKLFNGVLSEEENRYLFYSNFNLNFKSSSIT